MSQFVSVEFLRPWHGRRRGDRCHVWPNAAALLARLKVAAIVPVGVEAVEAQADAVEPPRRRGGWPKGRPRRLT